MKTDFAILAAVAATPTHPYQVLDHLASAGINVTRSTVYRRVDALVEEGLLRAEDGRGANGHMRRSLTLTGTGKKRLAAEVAAVLAEKPLESPLFAVAVAAANVCEAGVADALLRRRMASAARRLTSEEQRLRAEADAPGAWSRASRERGVAHLQADIAWLQGVVRRAG